jgi:hypothetical protein
MIVLIVWEKVGRHGLIAELAAVAGRSDGRHEMMGVCTTLPGSNTAGRLDGDRP